MIARTTRPSDYLYAAPATPHTGRGSKASRNIIRTINKRGEVTMSRFVWNGSNGRSRVWFPDTSAERVAIEPQTPPARWRLLTLRRALPAQGMGAHGSHLGALEGV